MVLGIALASRGSSSSPATMSSVAGQSPPAVGRTLRLHATGTTLSRDGPLFSGRGRESREKLARSALSLA
jgi:hypothetical protein